MLANDGKSRFYKLPVVHGRPHSVFLEFYKVKKRISRCQETKMLEVLTRIMEHVTEVQSLRFSVEPLSQYLLEREEVGVKG